MIGTYDGPAIWTRVDDPEQAARAVAAAQQTLTALPTGGHEAARTRLLATIPTERVYPERIPATAELAGAGSGLLTVEPVSKHLNDLATRLKHPR